MRRHLITWFLDCLGTINFTNFTIFLCVYRIAWREKQSDVILLEKLFLVEQMATGKNNNISRQKNNCFVMKVQFILLNFKFESSRSKRIDLLASYVKINSNNFDFKVNTYMDVNKRQCMTPSGKTYLTYLQTFCTFLNRIPSVF